MTMTVIERGAVRRAARITTGVVPLWAEELLKEEGMKLYVRSGRYEGCWVVEAPQSEDDFPSFTIVTDEQFSSYFVDSDDSLVKRLQAIVDGWDPLPDPYRGREMSSRGASDAMIAADEARSEGRQEVCADIKALIKKLQDKG